MTLEVARDASGVFVIPAMLSALLLAIDTMGDRPLQ